MAFWMVLYAVLLPEQLAVPALPSSSTQRVLPEAAAGLAISDTANVASNATLPMYRDREDLDTGTSHDWDGYRPGGTATASAGLGDHAGWCRVHPANDARCARRMT